MTGELAAPISIAVVYGTRSEAVKMAPLVLALRRDPRFAVTVIVTGQHGEMLDQANQHFGIVPDVSLEIHLPGQTLSDITTRTLRRLGTVLTEKRPRAMLVQGATSTAFAAALTAFHHRVPVVHVEAGLRTGRPSSPYPEEIYRQLITRLASLHLAPTAAARDNLLRENVSPSAIVVTGNSVIDALKLTVSQHPKITEPVLSARLAEGRPTVLVTAHRRESWGEPLRQIGRALARLADRYRGHDFVFPLHDNPLIRESIAPAVALRGNVILTEALSYPQFCALLERSTLVLTDSGGVQEEAPSLGKPVLVMRETTERPEAVAAGAARLVGTGEQDIVDAVSKLLDSPRTYARMARTLNPYGDGRAAERTVHAIARHFGLGDDVEEFGAQTGVEPA